MCRVTSIRILARPIGVLDDEQELARTHQTELFPRDGLDRGRILFQPADIVAKLRVLLSKTRQRRDQLCVLAARPHRLEESLVAHQGIHDEYDRDECKNVIEEAPPNG